VPKILKIATIIIVAIVLTVALAVTLVVTVVNPNDYKDKIASIVYDHTHRKLTINGAISWSFFPWLGIKVNDITLSNTIDFKNDAFAQIGELGLRIKLLPLIFKKVEIDKVVLKNLNLNLIKSSSGDTNWQDLMPITQTTQNDKKTNTKVNITNDMVIANIAIDNGNITWKNLLNNHSWAIKQLKLTSKNISFSRPFPITLGLSFHNSEPNIAGNLALKGVITCNLQEQIYAVNSFVATAKLTHHPLLRDGIDMSIAADFSTNLHSQNLNVDNFSIKIANLIAQGNLKGSNIINAPEFLGTIYIPNFNPKPLLQKMGYIVPNASWYNASLKTTLQTTSKFIKIPDLELKLDDSTLRGNASYVHFTDKSLLFNIDIDQINLSKLLLNKAVYNHKFSLKKKSIIADENTTATIPSDIKFNGDLKIGKLLAANLVLTSLKAELNGTQKVININPVTCTFYNGNVGGNLVVAISKASPNFSTNINFSGISLQSLLKAIASSEKFAGTLSGSIHATSSWNAASSILSNLSGSTKFLVTNGVMHGVDLVYQIARADALFKHKILPQESQPPKTNFGNLSASFKINNSIASTQDLLMLSPDFKVTGSGNANLIKQTLDFDLNAYGMHKTMENGKYTVKPTDFYVPIKITNTFANPKITPNIAVLVGQAITKVIKTELEKQLEKQKIPKELLKIVPLNKIFH